MCSPKPQLGHIHDNLIQTHEHTVSPVELAWLNNSRNRIGLFESPCGLIYMLMMTGIISFLPAVIVLALYLLVFPSRTVVTDRLQPVVLYSLLLYITSEPLEQHDKVTLHFVILTSCFFDIVVILLEHKSLLCCWPYCPTPHLDLRFGNCADLQGTDKLVQNFGKQLPPLDA